MKLVMVIYGASIDDEVMEVLHKLQIKKYTKLQGLIGQGQTAEPHLNNAIWPGENFQLEIVLDENIKDKLLQEIKNLSQQFARVGIKAFVLPVEETA